MRKESIIGILSSNKLMNELPLQFQNQFNHISPQDLEEILETLQDLGFLNKEGVEFKGKFWRMFIKQDEEK